MHKLSRQIRFAIDPFADSAEIGSNSYCAKPTSTGLALYFSLWVELESLANPDTGFVVNVSDIDKIIREKTIQLFSGFVKKHPNGSFEEIAKLLSNVWKTIENDFLPAKVDSLILELMPGRKLGIKEREGNMLYYSEKFEFAASHTLWNDKFSDEENFNLFGKCANKCGHGHNYIVEVTVKSTQQSRDRKRAVKAGDFEQIVDKHFISIVDHKNLNADVKHFKKTNPTVENIAEFAFKSLKEKFKPFKLDCVTVWENDRTFCSYRR
ncbi:MAG: 6-carboxytetrahydropterin synthase [Sedimentisphaerales bacterium]|nr:6-carboxytetrahydropterin synthase [Sedimentisphaerales bacterium]